MKIATLDSWYKKHQMHTGELNSGYGTYVTFSDFAKQAFSTWNDCAFIYASQNLNHSLRE